MLPDKNMNIIFAFLWSALFVMLFSVSVPAASAVLLQINPLPSLSLDELFGTIFGLAAGVLAITAWIKKQVQSNNTITIVISALVSLALSALGFWIQWGIFNAVEWYYIFIYGAAAMLIANGLSTWEMIKMVLVFLKLRIPNN